MIGSSVCEWQQILDFRSNSLWFSFFDDSDGLRKILEELEDDLVSIEEGGIFLFINFLILFLFFKCDR